MTFIMALDYDEVYRNPKLRAAYERWTKTEMPSLPADLQQAIVDYKKQLDRLREEVLED